MASDADLLIHRLLMIDDNPAIHEDYRKILGGRDQGKVSSAEEALFGEQPAQAGPAFDVDSAMQGRDGVERARRALHEGRPYSVAFVDMRMPPGWDGLETIEQLWKIDPEVQVVVCSAYTDYDWLELLTRLGHSDKLIVIKKPFEPIEILQSASALSRKWQNARALKHHIESLERAVTDRTRGLEAANRQLRHLASHDALTGLPNRLLLDDRVAQAIAQANRQGHEFALLVVDLDRFKLINDSLGHRAGDDLLREVAQRLRSAVRAVDTTARLGGDEFVILVDGSGDARRGSRRRPTRDRGDEALDAAARDRRAHLPEHRHRLLPARWRDASMPCSPVRMPPCTAPRSVAATTCSATRRA